MQWMHLRDVEMVWASYRKDDTQPAHHYHYIDGFGHGLSIRAGICLWPFG